MNCLSHKMSFFGSKYRPLNIVVVINCIFEPPNKRAFVEKLKSTTINEIKSF